MIRLFKAEFDHNSQTSLYVQLYRHIKEEIVAGRLAAGERLPSLRAASRDSGLSVTTCALAYEQLETEGYVFSRPQSGFYVSELPDSSLKGTGYGLPSENDLQTDLKEREAAFWHDGESFDFKAWRKCVDRVYLDSEELLFSRGDVQGEPALRREIARYVYASRGVHARPEQVVIGAGTQQLTAHLGRILKKLGIDHISVEDPGYLPVRQIFRDGGFALSTVPVGNEGISLAKLPVNIPSAVYVSPANQFPTGAVMPIARRYELLKWAAANGSIIIEDDYDSALRYFGRPIPALQGLDDSGSVVYMSSFSSTLYPAIRISYMVLPEQMLPLFSAVVRDYSQTCSKAEQLALAYFMEEGSYERNIRKKRALYSKKLQSAVKAFQDYGKGRLEPLDTRSGISLLLKAAPGLSTESFCKKAEQLGIRVVPLEESTYSPYDKRRLIFYYNQIPLPEMERLIKALCS